MKTCRAALTAFLFACSNSPSRNDAVLPEAGAGAPDSGASAPTSEQIWSTSWTKLPKAPSINGKQDDVHFVGTIGYSVNGLGEVYRSPDRGDTWEKVLDKPGTYFRAVNFLDDATRGFVSNIGPGYYPGVTDDVPLYQTSDSGKTWSPVTAIDGAMPKGICNFNRVDNTHLFAAGRVGGPSYFLSSSDAGLTWKSKDISGQIAMLVDVHFANDKVGVVTGASSLGGSSKCSILRTEDGGESWSTAFTSKATGEMCWKISFPSANIGYAAVLTFGNTPSSFIKTVDGGKTWEELPFVDGAYAALAVGFITDDIGWIGGETEKKPAYRTRDGGKTWEADGSLGPFINRFRFVGDRTGYAIGSTIYRFEVP